MDSVYASGSREMEISSQFSLDSGHNMLCKFIFMRLVQDCPSTPASHPCTYRCQSGRLLIQSTSGSLCLICVYWHAHVRYSFIFELNWSEHEKHKGSRFVRCSVWFVLPEILCASHFKFMAETLTWLIVSLPTPQRNLDVNSELHICVFFFCGALHELLMDWTPVGCLKIYRHLELSRSGFSLLFLFLQFEPFCFWTEFYIFAVSKMEQMIMFTLMMFTKMKLAALIVSPCWCACVINVVFILFML